jgi:signal transduction histidine kinase
MATLAKSLAHEIKNPLAVIRMNMELLHEDFEAIATPEARMAMTKIETVNRQCERLQTMLNDFLSFTKVTNLELVPGSLNDQVQQVLTFFEPLADRQGVTIQTYFDTELPSINLEPQTLHAALINLIKNALEAMPNGGELVARTRITRTGVALDLIDTGCGMTSNALLRMFEEFYTNKDGGTGLGLPTAKNIIEAHGGVINVQSEVDRGTQFTIEFPTPKRI